MPGGSTISRLYDFLDGMKVHDYHLDQELDRIHQWINGMLGNTNIAADANIVGSKLADTSIPLAKLSVSVYTKTEVDSLVTLAVAGASPYLEITSAYLRPASGYTPSIGTVDRRWGTMYGGAVDVTGAVAAASMITSGAVTVGSILAVSGIGVSTIAGKLSVSDTLTVNSDVFLLANKNIYFNGTNVAPLIMYKTSLSRMEYDAGVSNSHFFNNAVAVSSNLNVDSGTLFVDATNNRVGVNTITPSVPFEVTGNALVTGTVTASGNRIVTLDPSTGTISAKANAGGWNMGFGFKGSAGTQYEGYMASGATDSLTNYYIGGTSSTPLLKIANTSGDSIHLGSVVVGSKAADPTGANGMLYYDSIGNRLRAFVNSLWKTVTVA